VHDVPSPAGSRLAKPPWQDALFAAVDAKARENAELRATIAQLNARLYRANEARERWKLRQQAWHRERAELLARIDGGVGGG